MRARYHLDANVVLRFLRNDDTAQSPAAARLFETAKAKRVHLLVSAVTVAETFYVLVKVYGLTRAEVAGKLLPFIQSDVIEVESCSCVADALRRVAQANVDFGDGYLAATAVERGDKIMSFDEDLRAFSDVTTEAPV